MATRKTSNKTSLCLSKGKKKKKNEERGISIKKFCSDATDPAKKLRFLPRGTKKRHWNKLKGVGVTGFWDLLVCCWIGLLNGFLQKFQSANKIILAWRIKMQQVLCQRFLLIVQMNWREGLTAFFSLQREICLNISKGVNVLFWVVRKWEEFWWCKVKTLSQW